jgi:hypothetical protein
MPILFQGTHPSFGEEQLWPSDAGDRQDRGGLCTISLKSGESISQIFQVHYVTIRNVQFVKHITK